MLDLVMLRKCVSHYVPCETKAKEIVSEVVRRIEMAKTAGDLYSEDHAVRLSYSIALRLCGRTKSRKRPDLPLTSVFIVTP